MRLFSSPTSENPKPSLKRLAKSGDIDGLVRALDYRELIVENGVRFDLGAPLRMDAVEILAGSSDPRARDAIVPALSDESVEVRLAALRALRDRVDRHVVDVLARAVAFTPLRKRRFESEAEERLFEVTRVWRGEAIAALAAADAPAALEGVVSCMIHRAGDGPLEESDLEVLRLLQAASGVRDVLPEIAQLLVDWLDHESPAVAGRTAQALGTFGGSALRPLEHALEDPGRRVAAIRVLGRLRDKSVSSSISVHAEDADPKVRLAVMEALGELRDPAAVRALLNGANDFDYDVRTAACAALDRVGTAAVIVAFTSVVAPALERIADTTELNAGNGGSKTVPPRQIPRHAGAEPAGNGSAEQSAESPSGVRQLFDSIVSARTSGRGRRRSSQ
jgi:HEAT repeat protein